MFDALVSATNAAKAPSLVEGLFGYTVKALDGLKCVDTNAWFSTDSEAALATSKLFDEDNTLTPLGVIYQHQEPVE